MTALTGLVEPKTGTTADLWVGFSRGEQGDTDVVVTWEPFSRTGSSAATLMDIEHLRVGGRSGTKAVRGLRPATTGAKGKFSLPAGKALLRVTTYDAGGEVLDRWTQDVNVPAFDGVALSLATPRFLLARSAFELKTLRSNADATPSASRRLRKTDRLLVELEAYSSSGTPEISVELLNQKGESLVTLPVPADSSGKPRLEVPLQSLAPATYLLKVTAKTADKQVEQHAPFRIVP
jgi:hypothetical protein